MDKDCYNIRICEISVSQQEVPRAAVSSLGSLWTGPLQSVIKMYHMTA